MSISFHNEDVVVDVNSFSVHKEWIAFIIQQHKLEIGDINYIFTSNDYLLQINMKYLNHDYFTDIITFNYNRGDSLSADIYISIEQVKINAREYKCSYTSELNRVIIHGVLHLLGYDDQTEEEQTVMTQKEDEALVLFEELRNEKSI